MSIQFLNFTATSGYVIKDDETLFIIKLAKEFQKNYPTKRICFLRETWINNEAAFDLLKNIDYDILVTLCLMDEHNLDTEKFKNCITIGYVNSKFFYDSLSVFFSKRFERQVSINTDPTLFTKHFLSYNGKPHWHRINLVRDIRKADLLNYGYLSFASREPGIVAKITQDVLKENKIIPGPYDPLTFGSMEKWNTFFLNVVTETSYDPSEVWFWNEKTFKPILGYKPFLTYAPGGNVKMLRQYKFEDYTNDFKDISDLDLTEIKNIVPFLKVLCKQDNKYIVHKYKQLWPKIEYNRANFFNHARDQGNIFKKISNLPI